MTSIAIQPHDRIRASDDRAHPSALRLLWRRHAYIVPSFAICLLVCAWIVTWGDWKFFEPESFCGFYDAQARALLHGRFDVPKEAIGFEAFIFERRFYGYFAIGPALLHLPLVVLFKGMDGCWSRAFMLGYCFINLLCAYRILLWVRGSESEPTPADRFLNSLFILCAGIGSTNVYLIDRSYTYHEAIMCGSAFALLFTVAIVSYLKNPRLRTLFAASGFAFLSFHARPTAGVGALLVLCLLSAVLLFRCIRGKTIGRSLFGFASTDRPFQHLLITSLAVLITVAVYFTVNYGRFRTFDGVPLKYYNLYHLEPMRMQITGGRQIHPENIPTSLASYFGGRGIHFERLFPFVYMTSRPNLLGHPSIDMVEVYASIPLSTPALGLFALLGFARLLTARSSSTPVHVAQLHESIPVGSALADADVALYRVKPSSTNRHVPASAKADPTGIAENNAGAKSPIGHSSEPLRQMRLPMIAMLLGGGIILMTVGMTERYLHDLYPFLIIAAAAGVARISGANMSRKILPLIIPLALFSIYANCAFALEYQRLSVWGVPHYKRVEMQNVQQSVNHFLHIDANPASGE